jgi:hypothetical protein
MCVTHSGALGASATVAAQPSRKASVFAKATPDKTAGRLRLGYM